MPSALLAYFELKVPKNYYCSQDFKSKSAKSKLMILVGIVRRFQVQVAWCKKLPSGT